MSENRHSLLQYNRTNFLTLSVFDNTADSSARSCGDAENVGARSLIRKVDTVGIDDFLQEAASMVIDLNTTDIVGINSELSYSWIGIDIRRNH